MQHETKTFRNFFFTHDSFIILIYIISYDIQEGGHHYVE